MTSAPETTQTPAPAAGTKPVLLTLAAVAKTVPCSRHRVSSAVAVGDIEAAAFLDLDGRLQPLFTLNVPIVLLGLMRGHPHLDPTPPVFTSTQL